MAADGVTDRSGSRVRAVVFDFDDTMADSRSRRAPLMAKVLGDLSGSEVTAEAVRALWGVPFATLVAELAPSVDYDEFTREYVERLRDAESVLFPGATSLLRVLHDAGVLVVILTTGGRDLIRAEIANAQIDGCVTAVFGTEDTRAQKPDPRALEEVLAFLGAAHVGPSEIVYVGDSLKDLEVARGNDIRFLAVTTGTGDRAGFLAEGVADDDVFGSLDAVGLELQRVTDAPNRRLASIVAELDEEQVLEYYDVALGYASSWFTYHASQRLQGFNFFLVIQTAFLVAIAAAMDKGYGHILIPAICVIGFLSVFPFFLMEIRNTELVNNGRFTLDALEAGLSTTSWHRRIQALEVERKRVARQEVNVKRNAGRMVALANEDDALILPRQRDAGRHDLAAAMAIVPIRKDVDPKRKERRITSSLGVAPTPTSRWIGKADYAAGATGDFAEDRRWNLIKRWASHERVLRFMLLSIAAAWILGLGASIWWTITH